VIDLVSSEVLRARSRRVVWGLLAMATLGIVVGLVIATVRSTPPDRITELPPPPEFEQDFAACMRGEFVPEDQLPPEFDSLDAFCNETVRPEFYGQSRPAQLRLADLRSILEGLATIVIMLGVVLGASLMGAEWSAGSMATLLTWEPRRTRVLLARALAAAVTIGAVTVFLQLLFVVLYRIGVALRGSTDGADSDWLGQVAGVGLRTAAVAVAFGIVALAFATIGRSTTAAIGVLLAYLIGVEGFLASLITDLGPWLLIRNATAVIAQQPIIGSDPFAPGIGSVVRTVGAAWVVLGGWVVVTMALAAASFRVRDVN
jgi:ABC-2 type transport system permease protein